MEENETPQTGINRRQLLKRSAIVGGALVWATPVVQSLGGTALASVPSPGGSAPSWVAVVISCTGGGDTLYKFDFDYSQSTKPTQTCGSGTGLWSGSPANKIDGLCKLAAQYPSIGDLNVSCSLPDLGAYVQSDGLHIPLNEGCTVAAWIVHDGAGAGCGDVCFAPDKYAPGNTGWQQGYMPAWSSGVFAKPSVTTCPVKCSAS